MVLLALATRSKNSQTSPWVSRGGSDGNVHLIQPRRPTQWKTKLLIPRSAVVAAAVSRMYSFADEVTVESTFGGVGPYRCNHGARGLLISARVSLRHIALTRPATVVAQSLASSGRMSRSTWSFKTSSNSCVMVDWKNVVFGHNERRSKSRCACFTMRFCACLRSAQFSIHLGLVM